VLKLKNEDFSRDEKWVDVLDNDPLIAHEVQPTQTIAEMVRADELLKREFPKIKLPLLIMHGTADHATKIAGSKRFHEMASSTDKTLKLYEGHYHDLLNDLGKETVMADIIGWIDQRIPAKGAPQLVR
jgi:alpha-beta hydrolase superfamily lysophospholipase